MHIARRFTTAGQDPYGSVPFRNATSEIRNPDGSVVFQAEGIEVPTEWSQVACDIIAQKYFHKAGVPARLARSRKRGCRRGCGAAPPIGGARLDLIAA
jgi:ribonucleoside-diphosphate reductase alpha chain